MDSSKDGDDSVSGEESENHTSRNVVPCRLSATTIPAILDATTLAPTPSTGEQDGSVPTGFNAVESLDESVHLPAYVKEHAATLTFPEKVSLLTSFTVLERFNLSKYLLTQSCF